MSSGRLIETSQTVSTFKIKVLVAQEPVVFVFDFIRTLHGHL
jgi:hypothetical protein